MSYQIAVRLSAQELAALDAAVADGIAQSRSDAVRRSITYLSRYRSYKRDADILTQITANGEDIYPDLVSIPPSDFADLP